MVVVELVLWMIPIVVLLVGLYIVCKRLIGVVMLLGIIALVIAGK